MNDLDYKIIWHLDANAKLPAVELARKLGISRQTLNYRLQKLKSEKVLLGFIASVDIHRLGFLTHRLYLRYKTLERENEKEIVEHLVKHPYTLWVVSTSGSWDMEVVFTARNFIHFSSILKAFQAKYGEYFSKFNISMSPVSFHFKRDYLIGKKRASAAPSYYGFEPQPGKWDEVDISLLVQLSQNCRQSNEEIADKVGITAQTVKHRIAQLEEEKVIPSYRILLDLEKIGRRYVKVLLSLASFTEKDERKIYNFCAERNFVIYQTEVLGEWQMEIETEIESRAQLSELLSDLGRAFPDKILHHEVLEVTHEHKMNYFPLGEELLKSSASKKRK